MILILPPVDNRPLFVDKPVPGEDNPPRRVWH